MRSSAFSDSVVRSGLSLCRSAAANASSPPLYSIRRPAGSHPVVGRGSALTPGHRRTSTRSAASAFRHPGAKPLDLVALVADNLQRCVGDVYQQDHLSRRVAPAPSHDPSTARKESIGRGFLLSSSVKFSCRRPLPDARRIRHQHIELDSALRRPGSEQAGARAQDGRRWSRAAEQSLPRSAARNRCRQATASRQSRIAGESFGPIAAPGRSDIIAFPA